MEKKFFYFINKINTAIDISGANLHLIGSN